jgi:hypothetical protein
MTIALFVEDAGHLSFIRRLIERALEAEGEMAEILERNAVGGSASVIRSLRDYVRDLARGRETFAEVLVVAIDGNGHRPAERIRVIREVCERAEYPGRLVCAVPDPHVEAWYLADGRAVRMVTGGATQQQLPSRSREQDVYKRLLEESFVAAGIYPPLGGVEYGAEIADALDLDAAGRTQTSLGDFLSDLRSAIREVAAAGAA